MDKPDRYIPALGFGWLTSLYDPVVRWTTREKMFKSELLRQADLRPGDQVLDVGCGTGTLAIAAARLQPAAHVTGLDGDPRILAIASRKAACAGVPIELRHAMRVAFQAIRLLDGYETTADAVAGRLPALIAQAGFARVRHTRNFATVFGTMALYSGLKPN